MLGDPTTRPCFKSVEMFGFIWSSSLCLPSHQCNEWIMDLGLLRIFGLLGCVFMLNLHYYFGSGSNDQMMNDLHWSNHGKIMGTCWENRDHHEHVGLSSISILRRLIVICAIPRATRDEEQAVSAVDVGPVSPKMCDIRLAAAERSLVLWDSGEHWLSKRNKLFIW